MTRSEREELKPRVLKLLTSIPLKRPRPATKSGVAICSTCRWSSFLTGTGTWPIFSFTREATTWSSTALGRKVKVKVKVLSGALNGSSGAYIQ